jgi:Gluconate 2-dehydrogenase subunit 3
MAALTRRRFNQAIGFGTFAFLLGNERKLLTPAQAFEQRSAFEVLSEAEVGTLEALAEVLLPGSRKSGVAHFVDNQLAADDHDSLLMIRYFAVPKPFRDFYHGGLAALNSAARAQFNADFASLEPLRQEKLVVDMSREGILDWRGPPQSFFYFLVRNDAIDVVYGTVEGFEALGIPYMPHILPPALV